MKSSVFVLVFIAMILATLTFITFTFPVLAQSTTITISPNVTTTHGMKARILAVSFPLLSNNRLEQLASALHVTLSDPKSSLDLGAKDILLKSSVNR